MLEERQLDSDIVVHQRAHEALIASAFQVVRYDFAHGDVGLNNGVEVYTPVVGDVLLDAWLYITTAFNGTTPLLDIGTFVDDTAGLFAWNHGDGIDIADIDAADSRGDGMRLSGNLFRSLSGVAIASVAGTVWQVEFTEDNPLKLVVSQNGQKGGTAIGGTTGAGSLFLQIAHPS